MVARPPSIQERRLGKREPCVHICIFMMREHELEVFQRLGIDRETYLILRLAKKEHKKSMMQLAKVAIKQMYAK